MMTTEDERLLAWLRVALSAARDLARQLGDEEVPDPMYRYGNGVGVVLGWRVFLDGVQADEALIAEHTTDGRPWCSRCRPDPDAMGEPLTRVGVCRTLLFVATRYRHVVPGWCGEWAS